MKKHTCMNMMDRTLKNLRMPDGTDLQILGRNLFHDGELTMKRKTKRLAPIAHQINPRGGTNTNMLILSFV